MPTNRSKGQQGENVAAGYLEKQGYEIIARNVRTPFGEIDLIAQKNSMTSIFDTETEKTIVFVEVKSRTTRTFGPPEEAITPRKQAHLLASIHYYIQQNPQPNANWRLDIIAVEKYHSKQDYRVVHFENALSD
jgi:putative endonuclease